MFKLQKSLAYIFYAINLAIVFFAWRHFSGDLFSSGTSVGVLLSLGRLFGLLAMTMILAQVTIISRAPWLERYFGHDTLTRGHRLNGYGAFFLILAHPFLIVLAYAKLTHHGFIDAFLHDVLTLEDVLNALIAYVLLIAIVGTSMAGVRRRVKYESWYFFHLLIYVVIALVFGHQLTQSPDGQSWFLYYWYGLYIFAFGNLLLFRFARPVYRLWKYQFRVDHIEPGPSNTTSVYISGNNLEKLRIEAGQFMILRFLAKGCWWQAHPFSLSVAPNGKFLRVTIKASGDFTTNQIPLLRSGTRVLVDGPHGVFTRRVMQKNKVLYIAGGIGITPLRSMIEECKDKSIDQQLLYAVRSEGDIVFRSDFDLIPNLKKEYFIDKQRIDEAALRAWVPDIKERDVYVCGPPPMMEGIITILKKLGVPKNQIHSERFNFATK